MDEHGTTEHGMTAVEKQSFDEEGFFVRTAYSATAMDDLGAHVNRLIDMIEASPALADDQRRMILNRNPKAAAQSGPASLVKLFRISLFSRTMRAYMQDEQKVAVAQSLLGDDLFCPNDLYFLKPPGTGQAVAWHQDSWYFRNLYRTRDNGSIAGTTLGTWLAIDDADEENGCLWVIPGTHRRGVVAHEDDPNAEDIFLGNKLPKITAEMAAQAIPVAVPKGSVIFFNNALLHRSTPNRSDRYRRAYIVHYMKATVQHTERGKRSAPEKLAMWGWGTPETYICGRQFAGSVTPTAEADRLNWDVGIA